MASLITGNIKSLLTIKPKARCDDYTDQYHRIFMVKMSMVSALLLGLNWVRDTITCIIPKTADVGGDYVHQACWIQGFYIYKDIPYPPGEFRYYGIPKDIEMNGMGQTGQLCSTATNNPTCQPLTKTFYLQYQWFPFYIATIAFLYYLPYIIFRIANSDLLRLKSTLKGGASDVDTIVEIYFKESGGKLRLLATVMVKILYIMVNIVAFTASDNLLNGDFITYGSKWINWGKLDNAVEFDYTSSRHSWRPSEQLLPTFGLCDVLELGKDIKHQLYNSHRFVCEISQNILYQYVLALYWILIIIGFVVSVVGLLWLFAEYAIIKLVNFGGNQNEPQKKLYSALTLRECEYLECIRKNDMNLYKGVMKKLKEERFHLDGNMHMVNHRSNTAKGPYKDCSIMLEETVNSA